MTLTKADIAQKIAEDCRFMRGEAAEIMKKLLEICAARPAGRGRAVHPHFSSLHHGRGIHGHDHHVRMLPVDGGCRTCVMYNGVALWANESVHWKRNWHKRGGFASPGGGGALSESKLGIQELRSQIMGGMSEAQILLKFQITSGQLQRLLRRMMVTGYLSEMELFDWLRLTDSQLSPVSRKDEVDGGGWPKPTDEALLTAGENTNAPSVGPVRDEITNPLLLLRRIPARLRAEDPRDQGWLGFVRDLSDGGLRIASPTGDSCSVGDRKTLVLRTDELGQGEPIEMEVTCRWIRRKVRRVEYYVAGFEITRISQTELDKLRSFINELSNDMPHGETTVFVHSEAQLDLTGRSNVPKS